MVRLGPVWAVCVWMGLGAGCSAPAPADPVDGGDRADTSTGRCATDDECADGVYCNGAERCEPGATGATARGCVAASAPCPGTCDEAMDRCTSACSDPDADGDGARSVACGGGDCDDADPERFPGNTEVCDTRMHDEDCDPSTFGFRDADGDGAPDSACCNVDDEGMRRCGDDCDDARPGVNPAVPEVCDGRDNDCDTRIDEDVLVTYYVDADGDGYGSADPSAMTMTACSRPPGYSDRNDDCDDRAPTPPGDTVGGARTHPGGVETCDAAMADEDCNGVPNDVAGGCTCTIGTPPRPCTLRGACAAGNESCIGGAWSRCSIMPTTEVCDGVTDEDCDGMVDEGVRVDCYVDADGDGYSTLGTMATAQCRAMTPDRAMAPYLGCPIGYTGLAPSTRAAADCNDTAPTMRAFATCYRDCDGDGWSGDAMPSYHCAGAGGSCAAPPPVCGGGFTGTWVNRSGDCCPYVATVFPTQSRWFTDYEPSCAPDLGWDYDCSGMRDLQDRALFADCVSDGAGGCSGRPGWVAASAPDCGVVQNYQVGCEAYWDFDRWDCRGILESRRQGCH